MDKSSIDMGSNNGHKTQNEEKTKQNKKHNKENKTDEQHGSNHKKLGMNQGAKDIKDLTLVRGQDEKSQTPKGKISGLQRGSAELETNRNLSRGCRVSVLPSYRCLILFLNNFPILYVFRCFILFLTKHLCFVYIPSSVFPQNCFPLVKLIVDLSIYIRVLAIF
jgi:hypothetical protein